MCPALSWKSVSRSCRRLGVHCGRKEGHGENVRTRGKGDYSEKTKPKQVNGHGTYETRASVNTCERPIHTEPVIMCVGEAHEGLPLHWRIPATNGF